MAHNIKWKKNPLRWWQINYLGYDFFLEKVLYEGGDFFNYKFLVCSMEKFTDKYLFIFLNPNSQGSWYEWTLFILFFSEHVFICNEWSFYYFKNRKSGSFKRMHFSFFSKHIFMCNKWTFFQISPQQINYMIYGFFNEKNAIWRGDFLSY